VVRVGIASVLVGGAVGYPSTTMNGQAFLAQQPPTRDDGVSRRPPAA
jgi:hypothetical protein